MISSIEALKELRIFLLGYKIEIHNDYKNLVYGTTLMASDCLRRWKLILKRACPGDELHPGIRKIVVDNMNRMPMIDDDIEVKKRKYERSLLQEVHLHVQETSLKIVH